MLETYNDTSFQAANKTEIQFPIKKIYLFGNLWLNSDKKQEIPTDYQIKWNTIVSSWAASIKTTYTLTNSFIYVVYSRVVK